jgi:hypothetical protein
MTGVHRECKKRERQGIRLPTTPSSVWGVAPNVSAWHSWLSEPKLKKDIVHPCLL